MTEVDLLDRILTPRAAHRTTLGHPNSADSWSILGGAQSAAGISVDERLALNQVTFFSCVSILAEDTAVLPWYVWEWVDERNKEVAPSHPAYDLLLRRPNPYSTAFTFVATLVAYTKTWKNAYAFIERKENGDAIGLHPLIPDRVRYKFLSEDSDELIYEVTGNNGRPLIVPSQNMMHIPDLSIDGVGGMGIGETGVNAIGIAIEAERYAAEMFKNGSVMGGFIELPAEVHNNPDAKKAFVKSIEDRHAGSGNRHKIGTLPIGAKWQSAGVSPENSQVLESRILQKRDMCGRLKVPPYRVGDLADATFSNVEHQQIDYRTTAILPICKKLSAEANVKLIKEADRTRYFTEFLHEAYLQADQKSQNEALWLQRQAGVINANEWRGLTNRNEMPGKAGSTYWMPVNMQDAENPQPVKDLNKADNNDRGRDDARREAVKSAMLPLIVDAVHKMLRFEDAKVGKMLKTKDGPAKVAKWYGEHHPSVRQSIGKVVDSYFATMLGFYGKEFSGAGEQAACAAAANFSAQHCGAMAKAAYSEENYNQDAAKRLADSLVTIMDMSIGSMQ